MRRHALTHFVALICVVLLFPVTEASASCDGAPAVSGARTISVEGLTRTFVVRVASAYDGRTPAPVVLAFHPFGMNAQYMQTRAPIVRAWPGAIAVYPEAVGDARGARAWQSTPADQGNRDLLFFDAMLDWLDSNACIDRRRVFVLGYSNGAQFASLVACGRRPAIAGLASAAGRLPCAPAGATPVILSHGLQDRTIEYARAVEASEAWAKHNRCSLPPATGATGCFAGNECSAAPTILCTYAGGHEYDLPFTERAVRFFQEIGAP
jgi:polyhydroxybutyrate depolymerase